MKRTAITAIALAVGSLSSPALASDCSDALDQYRTARSDVQYALNRYSRCVSYSDGSDDCSSEFRRLKSAQDDLESAVSAISSYCR